MTGPCSPYTYNIPTHWVGMLTQSVCTCPTLWHNLDNTYSNHTTHHTYSLHTCVTLGAPSCTMFHPSQTPNFGPKYLQPWTPNQKVWKYFRQGISQGVRGWSYLCEKLKKLHWSNGVKSPTHAISTCCHTCHIYPTAAPISASNHCTIECRLLCTLLGVGTLSYTNHTCIVSCQPICYACINCGVSIWICPPLWA
jgi:hypothetical protein